MIHPGDLITTAYNTPAYREADLLTRDCGVIAPLTPLVLLETARLWEGAGYGPRAVVRVLSTLGPVWIIGCDIIDYPKSWVNVFP